MDCFGRYIYEKRKGKSILLREMAELLKISPAYLSDLENSRKYPTLKILEKTSEILKLTRDKQDIMYELVSKDTGQIPPDLPGYIMEKPIVRATLRKAIRENASDEAWQEFMTRLDEARY